MLVWELALYQILHPLLHQPLRPHQPLLPLRLLLLPLLLLLLLLLVLLVVVVVIVAAVVVVVVFVVVLRRCWQPTRWMMQGETGAGLKEEGRK